MKVRRVVTGHSNDNKAVFVNDDVVAPLVVPGINFEFLRLWGGDRLSVFPDDGTEPKYQTYFPPESGFRFGIFTIQPAQPSTLEPEQRRAAYEEWGRLFPGLPQHMEPASPGMHTSDSIDFGYIISGSIWLELDDGTTKELHSGDTYIQNGTRHAWRNRGSEPCSILVVVIGARREPSGISIAAAQAAGRR